MENKIQIFDNPEFGEVRVVMIDGEPWLVGKDVATALGYVKPTDAVRNHVPDKFKGVSEMETPGGKQNVVVINEAGMYKLVMRSKLESAEKFSDWVCEDVLPSLRKNGTYTVDNPQTSLENEISALVPIAWHGENILATPQLAKVYGVKRNTIIKVLSLNREQFAENVHFFKIEGDELRTFLDIAQDCDADIANHMAKLYLWTRQGAALQAKLLTTKRSRKAFKLLEVGYFGKPVTDCHTQKLSPQEKFNALLKCAELTNNAELRDSIIRQTVKLILS